MILGPVSLQNQLVLHVCKERAPIRKCPPAFTASRESLIVSMAVTHTIDGFLEGHGLIMRRGPRHRIFSSQITWAQTATWVLGACRR